MVLKVRPPHPTRFYPIIHGFLIDTFPIPSTNRKRPWSPNNSVKNELLKTIKAQTAKLFSSLSGQSILCEPCVVEKYLS